MHRERIEKGLDSEELKWIEKMHSLYNLPFCRQMPKSSDQDKGR
jgi:hypothetical protein